MEERMRRDDLAVRIRHEYPLWRVLEMTRQEVCAGEIISVPTLTIWPDLRVIAPEGAIIVRYLWNAVCIDTAGIGELIAPNSVVVDAILSDVVRCVKALIGRKIISHDSMPGS
jgi:hypothetical protein